MKVVNGLALAAFLIAWWPVAGAESRLCDTVVFQQGRLSLNANEKVLVCGSPKGSAAWREVPLSQAEYQLRIFLQNAGYMAPRFERRGSELWVWTGERLRVRRLNVIGAPDDLDPSRLRRVVGEPLTSELLDRLTAWALTSLKTRGYACPKVDILAQAWDQTVILTVEPGVRGRLRAFTWEGRGDLDRRILSRYAAAAAGEVYDLRASQLTTSRMIAGGLFEMALIQPSCDAGSVDLHLKTSVGAPRFFRIGFGASTEEFPFTDITYRNSRLDARASSFYTMMHASPILQNLTLGAEFYSLPWWPTVFWGPRLKLGRESEREFEVVSAKVGADAGRYWDRFGVRWFARGGPTLNYVDTVQGIGPSESAFLNWEGSLSGASRAYESSLREQYEGSMARFDYKGQRDRIGSTVNVDRFDFNFKTLWNIKALVPPLLVLATRVNAVAVNASPVDLRSRRDLLPVDYRIFWGGDQNLRGFSRLQLNNGGRGYLTALYGGVELRLIEVFPFGLEPFLLGDIARLGERRWTLDRAVFLSWGGGLRWASPIGTLRFSAARGEISADTPSTVAYGRDLVYFFSFGQEF